MKRIDFENGTVTVNILGVALPMLVAQIINLLYNVVDRIYIARIPGEGTAALGAVGLCFPMIVIITAFSNLFGSGGAPLFSIERGKKNQKKAANIMGTSFTMLCFCGVILMIIGSLFAQPILTIFGTSQNAMKYAYPYLMIYLIGTLPSMISVGMNPFINAQGYSLIGMLSVMVGAVSNLLLDPLFIFKFGWGVRGAAIATVISQCMSAVFVLYFLIRKAELKLHFLHKEDKSFFEKMMQIIDSHIQNTDLSVELLSSSLGYSTRQFYRKLKNVTEKTPADIIREYRLTIVERLLLTTQLSIEEIMDKTGFSNRGTFYKAFAQKFEMTPKQYRNIKTKDVHDASEEGGGTMNV